MARPSSYNPEYAPQAEKLCKLGATDKEMADFFGVSEKTLNTWKQAHPEFLQSLKKGKVLADANVAERLYQRAMGYTHEAVKIFPQCGTENGPLIVPYTEHYPPDTTAAIFWLKNRARDKWRDKTEQEVSGKDGAPLTPVLHVSLSQPGPGTAPQAGGSSTDGSH